MELRISIRSRLKVNNLYFIMIMKIGHRLNEEEVDRRRKRYDNNIKERTGMDFASLATRAAKTAKTGQDERSYCEVICSSQTTFQSYGID